MCNLMTTVPGSFPVCLVTAPARSLQHDRSTTRHCTTSISHPSASDLHSSADKLVPFLFLLCSLPIQDGYTLVLLLLLLVLCDGRTFRTC
jgi:hypothetical protein